MQVVLESFDVDRETLFSVSLSREALRQTLPRPGRRLLITQAHVEGALPARCVLRGRSVSARACGEESGPWLSPRPARALPLGRSRVALCWSAWSRRPVGALSPLPSLRLLPDTSVAAALQKGQAGTLYAGIRGSLSGHLSLSVYTAMRMSALLLYFYRDLNPKPLQLSDWHFLRGNFEGTQP